MRILIITMDDPVQTNSFIKKIIENKHNDIIGIAITKKDRLSIKKGNSKVKYILSLLLIMGLSQFIKNSFIILSYKFKKKINHLLPTFVKDPSLKDVAKKYNIRTWEIQTPNNKNFLEEISTLEIDIIINQSQNILKKDLLSIPKIGIINRHNALLPKNRGRLTPFWVLYNDEKETGVSIHFVTEELDAGDIIVQKKINIDKNDNFNSLVKKNYELAPIAMLEAIDKLEEGFKNFIPNSKEKATYNTTPTFREAFEYRKKRLKKFIKNLLSY